MFGLQSSRIISYGKDGLWYTVMSFLFGFCMELWKKFCPDTGAILDNSSAVGRENPTPAEVPCKQSGGFMEGMTPSPSARRFEANDTTKDKPDTLDVDISKQTATGKEKGCFVIHKATLLVVNLTINVKVLRASF